MKLALSTTGRFLSKAEKLGGGGLFPPSDKGPFRSKNAIAMEVVVFCYRGSILLSVPTSCHFSQAPKRVVSKRVVLADVPLYRHFIF